MGTIFYDPKVKAIQNALPMIADDIILYLQEKKSWKDILPDFKQIKTYNIVPSSIFSLLCSYFTPFQAKVLIWLIGIVAFSALASNASSVSSGSLRDDIEDYLSSARWSMSDWDRGGFSREEIGNFSDELSNIIRNKLGGL